MKLRFAEAEHSPEIAEIYAEWVERTTYSFEYEPPSAAEMEGRRAEISKKHAFLVAEEEGRVLGYAYNSNSFERRAFDWCAELSVYLKKGGEGRGIGSALVSACEQIARLQGYCKMYSLVSAENENSLAFHEKRGYRPFARFAHAGYKLGRWVDLIWLEKDFGFPPVPPPPRPIGEVLPKAREILRRF